MRALLCAALLLLATPAWAATRYIAANGADTNTSTQAQSKSTPWARLPCMANATSNAAAYTPVAGDTFVLKGGDTWANASFPCTWSWSGTAGNVITIGVDQTWFTGGTWVRPIWDAGGVAIVGTKNIFFNGISQSYWTLDNIEMKGFFWSGSPAFAGCAYILAAGGQFVTLDHLYLHGWHHAAVATDDCFILLGDGNSPYMNGSVLQNSVIDGADSDPNSMSVYEWPSAKNNIFHAMASALLIIGSGEISGNLIYGLGGDFTPGYHTNAIESLGSNGTFYIHDNVIHDIAGSAESSFLGNPGEIHYVWNNLYYNLSDANPPAIEQGTTASYWWNNTIIPKAGNNCLSSGHAGAVTALTFQNNHCITTASQALAPALVAAVTTLVQDHNILQTPTVANGQGYTSSQTPYVYAPTAAGNSTVGAGANLTSSCTGSNAGLCSDTTYGSVVGSGNAISGAGRGANAQPASGAWDAGAYKYLVVAAGGGGAAPRGQLMRPGGL